MKGYARTETNVTRLWSWSGIFWLATVTSAHASQTPLTLEDLCRKSERITVGTVQSMRCYQAPWPRVGTITFTDVTIRVEEIWKGTLAGRDLVIQIPGGQNPDGSTLHVSETPRFRIGERALVFTYTYRGRHWIYGWEQGKYNVVVERVVGRTGMPIPKDILSYPLKRRIETILNKKQ